MTDSELLAALDARQAVIVHLSHLANMRPGGVFPDDLQAAIANKAAWTLSCVVLWPGHAMDLPGSVGVIFRPRAISDVISVAEDDAGAMQFTDGTEGSLGAPLSAAAFDRTFTVRSGGYNEWRVRNCDLVGIFAASENCLLAKKTRPSAVAVQV